MTAVVEQEIDRPTPWQRSIVVTLRLFSRPACICMVVGMFALYCRQIVRVN